MQSFSIPTWFLAIICSSTLYAEIRPWKSATGEHTLEAEFIKRDATNVTLRNERGKEITVELAKLHQDETKWLDINHPLAPKSTAAIAQDPSAFFDNLTFKDTRESTLAKLKASKVVEMTTDETFIGRSGLNGVFRTRKKIGNLDGFLYFDWNGSGKLAELSLQTETRPESAYKTELEPAWKALIELMDTLYGKAVQRGPLPAPASIADSSLMPSHLWKIETGGSALLGTARDGEKLQIVVRFTEKKVGVVELP
jgi:SLA1 homology domain 1, SHD1